MKEKILNYQLSIFNLTITPKSVITHPLFSGSAIMIVGSNFTNFIAYVYHIVVGRLLGPTSYGELVTILALMGLFFTSFNFLSLVIVKFVSSAKKSELNSIFYWFTTKVYRLSLVFTVLLTLLIPVLSNYLHIKFSVLILLVPILLVGIISIVYRAFLQGLMKFKKVVVSTVVDLVGRLVLGIIFIYLGFSVFGAVSGIFLSSFIAFLFLRLLLREYGGGEEVDYFTKGKKVFKYSISILFASIASNSIFSTDVILVKHYFNPFDAGIYGSLSTLGKIIFYGTAPVAAVMFPMVSKRHSKGQAFKKVFILSFLLVAGIASGVVLVFWLFPDLSIKILFGNKYLDGAVYLTRFGIFMLIFSVSSLLLNFHLSREKTYVVFIALITAIMQIAGIGLFHDSIASVIDVSITAVSFMFVSLLLPLFYENKKGKII